MAESIVLLRKKIKNSLTRQGMWNIRGLHREGLAEREEKERVLSSERAHKQVLTVKKNMRGERAGEGSAAVCAGSSA